MKNISWVLFLSFGLFLMTSSTHTERDGDEGSTEEGSTSGDAESPEDGKTEDGVEEGESEYKQFVCNLQYKRIGCYASADEEKENKPVSSIKSKWIMKQKVPDIKEYNEKLPKHVCMCANEALTSGNAIFGIMNYTECWSGPDDSKYDREGPSNECITFDLAPCEPTNEICAGKELANFMYYIDTPAHNKTPEEVEEELDEERKKLENTDGKNRKGEKGGKKGKKGKTKNNTEKS